MLVPRYPQFLRSLVDYLFIHRFFFSVLNLFSLVIALGFFYFVIYFYSIANVSANKRERFYFANLIIVSNETNLSFMYENIFHLIFNICSILLCTWWNKFASHILLTCRILYCLNVHVVRSYKVKYVAIEMYVFTIASMDIFMSIRFVMPLNQDTIYE